MTAIHASTADDIVAHVEGRRPCDVILLRVPSDAVAAATTLLRIRTVAANVPVVVYTPELSPDMAVSLLQAGAQACLVKEETTGDALVRAVLFSMIRHERIRQLELAHTVAAHRATHDPLTGLANRELFLDQFERALALGTRHDRNTGLLFLDLDGFKEINDHFGHASGDAILRIVSARLLECVRRSDSVARLGGDEFVVLLCDVSSRSDITQIRDAIRSSIRQPMVLGIDRHLVMEASVGCAMAPLDGATALSLLDAADADMYREKFLRRPDRMTTPATGMAAHRTPVYRSVVTQAAEPVSPALITMAMEPPRARELTPVE
jgi:diguanylate cyclase (GGDEF)-like protein